MAHQTAKTQYVSTEAGNLKFAYRRFGTTTTASGVPLLFLIHFRGTMDKWDPLLINSIAAKREVILVDYAGLGQSSGRPASSFRDSASDIATFLSLISVREVDVLGFSIGAFVGQMLALNHGQYSSSKALTVRKLIIAGSSSSLGPDMPETANNYKTAATSATLAVEGFKELFFPRTAVGAEAADAWWARLAERSETTSGEPPSDWGSQDFKDGGIAITAQGEAYGKFLSEEGSVGDEGSYSRLAELKMPVLVAQGSDDFMFPTINSFWLSQKVPNGQLIIYPHSGHGFLYQYAEEFAKHVNVFLGA